MKYLTVKSTAAIYMKSMQTIRRWITEGKLSAKKDPGGRNWIIVEKENTEKKP